MRNLSEDMVTALQEQTVRPCFFLEIAFDSGTLRLWTGRYDRVMDGETWLGNGWLRVPDDLPESDEIDIDSITINLSGIPQSLISIILSDSAYLTPARLWFGLLDSNYDVIEYPVQRFNGYVDVPELTIDPENESKLSITLLSENYDLDIPRELRCNSESQKAFDPTDTGFRYVPYIQTWSGSWGKPKSDKLKLPNRKRKRGKAKD